MVTAPMCKVCGSRHFGGEHSWSSPAKKPTVELSYTPIPQRIVDELKKPSEDKPKFDRNAYQREYMRKRRAQKEPK